MKVVQFSSRTLFGDFYPRAQRLPEGTKFLAGTALVFWGPVLLFSSVINHPSPFYLMLCIQLVGVVLGIFWSQKVHDELPHCFPKNSTRKVQRVKNNCEPKAA